MHRDNAFSFFLLASLVVLPGLGVFNAQTHTVLGEFATTSY